MLDLMTPGAERALRRARRRAHGRASSHVELVDLLVALASDTDGRAHALLVAHGADIQSLFSWLGVVEDDGPDESAELPFAADLRVSLQDASWLARSAGRGPEVGTEHLLAALLDADAPLVDALVGRGLRVDELRELLRGAQVAQATPIPLPADIGGLELSDPGESADLGRILDASANRAREGLRVVEDYARFALDDPGLTRRLKDVRHRLAEALRGLDPQWLTSQRDTPGDVGAHIMTAAESTREDPRGVLIANFKRAAEALRSLEEYAKLVDVWVAGRFEVLRYDVYVLEKLVLAAQTARKALGNARLYVLVGGEPTLGDLSWVVGEALEGGAQVIQLREKDLPDREWLTRAREVRILTAKAGARFVANDRPDLAVLSGADAVHLGQEDVTVRDARRIVGHRMGVGVSTHSPQQVDAAILAGATYLGVGPVFTSQTKAFGDEDLVGLALLRTAAETTALPWFAIGGIDEQTIDAVLEAGAMRVAVGRAISGANSPRQAAARLRARLDHVG
jgi:thiamine-phosphate pyrophosphorylase